MMKDLLPALTQSHSKRRNFLSEGVKLCAFVCAICAAPLPWVDGWRAAWLLGILTIVGLGTFGLWAFSAAKNRKLIESDSEEHTEHLAAIAVFGQNREGKSPLLTQVEQSFLIENDSVSKEDQEASDGEV